MIHTDRELAYWSSLPFTSGPVAFASSHLHSPNSRRPARQAATLPPRKSKALRAMSTSARRRLMRDFKVWTPAPIAYFLFPAYPRHNIANYPENAIWSPCRRQRKSCEWKHNDMVCLPLPWPFFFRSFFPGFFHFVILAGGNWFLLICRNAVIIGPADTPFEDGTFKLVMQFDENYPNKPPQVKFISRMVTLNSLCAERWL